MNIEIIGHDVRLTFPVNARTAFPARTSFMLSALEVLDLAHWVQAHELELQVKAFEAERRAQQAHERTGIAS